MQWHIKAFYEIIEMTWNFLPYTDGVYDSYMYAIFTYYKELKWNNVILVS